MACLRPQPHWLLFLKAWLFFTVSTALYIPLLAGASPHDIHTRRNLVSDNTGFISIDCGGTEDYTDNETGIFYQSDREFIDTGIGLPISNSSETDANLQQQLKNVRSFPQGTRNCYSLKPEGGKNSHYLIRASFFYGNYDGKNQTPKFDLYIGVNIWSRIDWEAGYAEIIHTPPSDYINVCLFNTGNGVPYISALELRPIGYPVVQNISTALVTMQRYGVGGKSDVRYPDDAYDRIWNTLSSNTLNSTSTNSTIVRESNDIFRMPDILLRTTVQELNANCSLSYFWNAPLSDTKYFVYFHFTEIQELGAEQRRQLQINLNGQSSVSADVTLEYLKPQSISLNDLPGFQGDLRFSISSAQGSELPPVLNGFEIYALKELQNASTVLADADALTEIKQTYKVMKNWQGDPCVPSELLWEGLTCSSNNPPRVISLNMSFSNLTGEIPASLYNLREIISLDLSYNNLTGLFPAFLADLPKLKMLNATGNKLKGSVPRGLLQKSEEGTLILSVGENPDLCSSFKCQKKSLVLPVVASCIAALFLVILFGVFVMYRRRKQREAAKLNQETLLKSKNPQLKYSDIVTITENFSTVIGEGGFGKVYLGTLIDKRKVAVKVLSLSSRQGYKEFRAEAQILMIVHHRNLVTLVGYCDEGESKALVYEYMSNGNLRQHLSEGNADVPSWIERLEIAVNAAQGLDYLHNGCKPPIIHRDMKTANILLDEHMQAKIADFGLSRVFSHENDTHLSTCPAGTFGYVDPQVHTSLNFSKKSDVYSFGIVLLELITGRPAIIRGPEYNTHIVDWVKPLISIGDIIHIVDPRLEGDVESCSAHKAIKTAMSCTLPTAVERQDISHVLAELVECLEMVRVKDEEEKQVDNNEKASYNSIGSEALLSPR